MHSQTDPTKGLGGVSGARQLNAISLLFVLVMISLTQPRQALCAQLFALSAQGVLACRHQDEPPIVLCSGASAFDYCSACYHRSARDTEDTIACKTNSHSTGFNVDRKGTLVRTLDALRRNTMKNGHYYFLASPLSVELID